MIPGLAEHPIAHGYTLTDLDKLTRAAIIADRSMAMPHAERHDIAWSAIAEHLYAAESPPSRQELIRVGWAAIYHEVRDGRRHNGYRDRQFDAGLGSAPRFARFWTHRDGDFETDLVERLGAREIFAALRESHRDAVLALATFDDHQAAATALGISYKALCARMVGARREFTALWLEHETPPGSRRGDDDACGRGHAFAEHGRINGQGKRHCMACARIRRASARRHGTAA